MTNHQLWEAVLGEIEVNLSRVNFITWFKNTYVSSFEDNNIIICVPNAFVKKWLEEKYNDSILTALKNISKQEINNIIYKVELKKEPERVPEETPSIKQDNPETSVNIKENKKNQQTNRKGGLNPRYVFDSFIVGKGNELAHAACKAVINNLGKAYNPLFIYGGVGLGKTHLVQALGNAVLEKNYKVLYTTSEKFTNNYIQAVRTGRAREFKNLYRKVDLLIVDDVQFMGGKDGTQEEFFHTFNELQQNDKQIVITSDRPPKSIPAIEKRLISRFEAGMVADVGKPDLETKIAILEKKANEKNYNLDKEIITYIAEHIQNNIRELEGALIKVIVAHDFKGLNPNMASVKEVLGDFISNITVKSLTPREIIEVVAKFYDITYKDLIGSSRKKELVLPRQIAIYMIREELNSSYPNIGNEFGGRDHTTAMHAYNKIKKEVENNNEKMKQELASIKQLFTVNY